MLMLLLLSALAWAVPTKTLEAGIDRRVILVDMDGRQIDCSLVAVEDTRLVVRLDDGSLAEVERSAVVNLVDLGPAPPPPVEEEPEDDFGEDPLDEETLDDFDVEEVLEEILEEGVVEDPVVEDPVVEEAAIEEAITEEAPVLEERAELPEDDLALPESDGVSTEGDVAESEAWEEPSDPVATDPVATDAVADVQPEPAVEPERDPEADSELYYRGRADGAAAAKGAVTAMPQGLGFLGGCVGSCAGCTAATLTFALMEPTVPTGDWQDREGLYQQGYVQAYRDTYQREAARRAFAGGALGAATTTVVAIALIAQL